MNELLVIHLILIYINKIFFLKFILFIGSYVNHIFIYNLNYIHVLSDL